MAAGNHRYEHERTTIQDVARRADVSVGTVSRVLNGHPSVRGPMRDAVLRAVKELRYEPNAAARMLRASRSKTIGILVDDVVHTMNGLAVHGAERAAEARGYAVFVAETHTDPNIEQRLLQTLLARKVEGLLAMPARSRRALAEVAASSGVPIVFYGQLEPRRGTISAVIEETAATRQALQHLVEHGHKWIALAGLESPAAPNRIERIQHLLAEISPSASAGAVVRPLAELPGAVARLLSEADAPSAIIPLTHRAVPSVLLGVRSAGLTLPGSLSLVCYGDSDWAEAHTPPLNVIRGDYEGHVAAATDLLLDAIEGAREFSSDILHHSDYVVRGSVGPAPTPTRMIRTASRPETMKQ